MFLFNRKLSCFVINDHNSDPSYSLNKIILDISSVFFGLIEAGNSQPGSGLLPRLPQVVQKAQFCSRRILSAKTNEKKRVLKSRLLKPFFNREAAIASQIWRVNYFPPLLS